MTTPAMDADDRADIPTAQRLGESFAALIGGESWEVDQLDTLDGIPLAEAVDPPLAEPVPEDEPVPALPSAKAVIDREIPPTPLQLIEAMLFVGGAPLTAERACEVVRGLTPAAFRESIELLNRVCRLQNRPYVITANSQGYTLTVRPRFRTVRDRLYRGPREARLSQAGLDVLSLIAYRQPIGKGELDTIRGSESENILRQLLRLGLIEPVTRAESERREVAYGTTARFLDVFGIKTLEDLPRIEEAVPV